MVHRTGIVCVLFHCFWVSLKLNYVFLFTMITTCLNCIIPGLPPSLTGLSLDFVGIWVHNFWIRNPLERLQQVTWKVSQRVGVTLRGIRREGAPKTASGSDITSPKKKTDCIVTVGKLDSKWQGFQLHYRAITPKDGEEVTEPPGQEKPWAPHDRCCLGNRINRWSMNHPQ